MTLTREKFKKIINEFPTYKKYLTEKQKKILNLYMDGYNYKEIGKIMEVTGSYISFIIGGSPRGKGSIYKKLITKKRDDKLKGEVKNNEVLY